MQSVNSKGENNAVSYFSENDIEWEVFISNVSAGRTTTANRHKLIEAARESGLIFKMEDIEFRLVKKETV